MFWWWYSSSVLFMMKRNFAKKWNVSKYFVQDCLKIYLLVFSSLKMHWNSKNDQFLVKKVEPLQIYCPTAIGTAFHPKFVFDAKVHNSAFWNISYLGLCCNWIALSINLKNKWVFRNTKISRKCQIKRSRSS